MDDFRRHKDLVDGRQPYCIDCREQLPRLTSNQWKAKIEKLQRPVVPAPTSRTCTKCSVEKSLDAFSPAIGADRKQGALRAACIPCERVRRREFSRLARKEGRVKGRSPEARSRTREVARERRRRLSPEARAALKEKNRRYRQRKAIEEGRILLPPNGAGADRGGNRARLEADAKRAWRGWLKDCPNWWMRAYYRALGRPWANPRLSDASAWRIRYWLDPAFRAKEIQKAQVLKVKRRERIEATQDGTLTGAVIVQLFAAAKTCRYCCKPMRSVEKSLDHVTPLSKGGAHSINNVVVCCKPCNYKKGRKLLPASVLEQVIHGGTSARLASA